MLDKFTKKNIKKILICYLVLSVDDPDFIIVLARYIQDRTSTLGQDLLGSWIYPGQGLHTRTRSVRELDVSRTGPPHQDKICQGAGYIQDRASTLGQDLLGSWIYPGQGLHTKTRSVRELDISRTGPPHYRTRYVRELDVSRTVHSLQDKIGQ